jgi:hypothetical protein
MVLGVLSFSYATGALTNIINNLDSKDAQIKEKISTLNLIQREYDIDNDLFNKLARAIKYDHHQKFKTLSTFMDELPHKAKIEL